MNASTTHVIPWNGGWVVRKEGWSKRGMEVYSTQKKAIQAARKINQRTSAGQIVIHGRNGSFRSSDLHGMPAVHGRRRKGTLSTRAIKVAVSSVIRERLLGE